MRIASFRANCESSFGLVVEGGVVDLGKRLGYRDVKILLGEGIDKAKPYLSVPADYGHSDIVLLPPVPAPTHILGIGLNTKSHFEETAELMKRAAGDYPAKPRIFFRSPLSMVSHGSSIVVPKVSRLLDYEGEIALIIGKPGRHIAQEAAMDHVAGFSLANDGSVRDYQQHSNQVTAGKNFAASGGWGPYIVTTDEIADWRTLTLTTSVNGEQRQALNMDDLIFTFEEIISYISEFLPLQSGDLILTGSSAGIGAITRRFLIAGDKVDVSSPQLGSLLLGVKNET